MSILSYNIDYTRLKMGISFNQFNQFSLLSQIAVVNFP